MSDNPNKEKPLQSADNQRKPDNGKPLIVQPGPIIIKGGSLEIDSPIFKFKDKDQKEGKNYKLDKKGSITRIVILDGDNEVGDIEPKNKETTIVITFTPT
jgi:hypothetical protein